MASPKSSSVFLRLSERDAFFAASSYEKCHDIFIINEMNSKRFTGLLGTSSNVQYQIMFQFGINS